MSQPDREAREVRVIDEFGFDITDRIIADYGSVEAMQEQAAQVRAFLEEGAARMTAALD